MPTWWRPKPPPSSRGSSVERGFVLIRSGSRGLERQGRFIREFGERVTGLREAQDISQEELAFRANLHRTPVSMIEQAKRSSTLETIEKLAKALWVQPSELMPTIRA